METKNTHKQNNTGAVIWFTGLSGSGKSTIAEKLVTELSAQNLEVEYLDGDKVRDVFPQTGFSREERNMHIKRIGFLASILEKHGIIVVASFISPYKESREFVRKLCKRFIEIYISTPLSECMKRDPKGLYARAKRGEIQRFTGIDDPYEPPENPALKIDTSTTPLDKAVSIVIDYLQRKCIISSFSNKNDY